MRDLRWKQNPRSLHWNLKKHPVNKQVVLAAAKLQETGRWRLMGPEGREALYSVVLKHANASDPSIANANPEPPSILLGGDSTAEGSFGP